MDMIRHHFKLMQFYDGIFIREMYNFLSDDFSEILFLNICTAWIARCDPCIAHNGAEELAVFALLEDYMIDEWDIIIMIDGSPMIRMFSTLFQ